MFCVYLKGFQTPLKNIQFRLCLQTKGPGIKNVDARIFNLFYKKRFCGEEERERVV